MKNIYVVLSSTPTMMGKFIRVFTRSFYNHSSISLTENLNEMYSFARYRASNPLVGGFVKEFPERFTLGKQNDVCIKVFKIPVTEEQYEAIKLFIYKIKNDREENIYNSLAAIGVLLGCKFDTYKAYTCSDFVVRTLVEGNVLWDTCTFKNIIPDEIHTLLERYTSYSGCLKAYKPIEGVNFDTEDFFEKSGVINEVAYTLNHFYRLIKRNILYSFISLQNFHR
ncbi:hypothetical protein [Ruminiclostridium josui]|uniref:hypothetical protein n=1 Tax=Ruminiclostridium josui TaxID=1499 RepID=UPI000A9E6DFC|nr:hypothetical protein [Ruminiclostridium josui]